MLAAHQMVLVCTSEITEPRQGQLKRQSAIREKNPGCRAVVSINRLIRLGLFLESVRMYQEDI